MSGESDQGQCPWLEADALSGHSGENAKIFIIIG